MALRTLSVCAGIGGIDLALRRRARTVCYVEREPFAVAVLTSRMRSGDLDDAPIWDDLRTFDGRPWRGCVDLIAGGIPCQPNSLAGKRQGGADDRDLWPDFRRVVREVGPRFAFVENVPGLLSVEDGRSFGRILGDLAEDGYDAAWCCLPAADVGARHRRERVFVLGWMADPGRVGRERSGVAPVMGGAPGPRASEGEKGPTQRRDSSKTGQSIPDMLGIRTRTALNPAWVACLMGYGPGWLSLDPESLSMLGSLRASSRAASRTARRISAPSATPSSPRKSKLPSSTSTPSPSSP